jgi:hypothetical protein
MAGLWARRLRRSRR